MREDELVFGDEHGNYYVLSRETLERARATGERRAEIERALKADDTSGFAFEIISPNQTFPDLHDDFGPPLKLTGILRFGKR